MNVRDLKNRLSLLMKETAVSKTLDRTSHWVKKLRFEDEWYEAEGTESETLKKLETLGIVSVKEVNGKPLARLTADGEELYRDFMALGYY